MKPHRNNFKYVAAFTLILWLLNFVALNAQESKKTWQDIDELTPAAIKFDTLRQFFLYENLIYAYEEGDMLSKSRSFVGENNGIPTYKNGIFIYLVSDKQYEKLGIVDTNKINSVYSMVGEMQKIAVLNNTEYSKTNINPYCGAYYRRYCLNMEVKYLGQVEQRLPLFEDCNSLDLNQDKHGYKNYQILSIPTYLITEVFTWSEIIK